MSAPSRLSRFMGLPDGLNPDQALAAADENLNAHRDTALGLIDKALGELVQGQSGQVPAHAVARLADSIASLAGMFELLAMSQAAHRLADAVRVMTDRQAWDQDLVIVHIAALRLLRLTTDPAGGEKVLRGLEDLATRLVRRSA